MLVCKYSAKGELDLLFVRQGVLHFESFLNNNRTLSRQFNHPEQLELTGITDLFVVNGNYFFLTSPRVSVSMCLAGTDKIVLAKFKEPMQVEEGCTVDVSFPKIYVFGGMGAGKKVSKDFWEINLMTFQMTNLSKSDTYCPEARYNHLSYLKDDRMYVWGGLGKDSTPVADGLLWTYDFEKTYWFALEMSSPITMERTLLRVVER